MEKGEREVLLEQLEELLGEPAVDVSDALEIATCAGLAHRLGATDADLADARAWRDGLGKPLLDELFQGVDVEPLVDGVEAVLGQDTEDRELEDVVFDFDDLVAAAIWCGRESMLKAAAGRVAATIRLSPETFGALAPYGKQISRLANVGEHYAVYDYWMALADCG
ncbi:MAG: hypothetical protein H6736_07235 [Alphaproteobacteria bacterium]|nr:hypothetical protein [Alphaproteobacteria bacterium]MCB9691591.1 hypothetical protein [Alphaproteobacteria bacterium]